MLHLFLIASLISTPSIDEQWKIRGSIALERVEELFNGCQKLIEYGYSLHITAPHYVHTEAEEGKFVKAIVWEDSPELDVVLFVYQKDQLLDIILHPKTILKACQEKGIIIITTKHCSIRMNKKEPFNIVAHYK